MRRLIVEEPVSRAAIASRNCAFFALAVGAVGFLVTRFQIVDPGAGLAIFGSAIVLACIALLFAAAAAVVIWRAGQRGLGQVITAALLSFAFLGFPGWLAIQAIRLPVINDISTDIADPPQFSLSPLALEMRGSRTPVSPPLIHRVQQRVAYPGVQAILLELDADEAYQLVLRAIQARGWKIIDQSAPGRLAEPGQIATGDIAAGHIDAVARTAIIGFPDDVTVRVRPMAGQTKVDVRSVSRYGRNDFGVNAQRIEQFAQELQNQLDAR